MEKNTKKICITYGLVQGNYIYISLFVVSQSIIKRNPVGMVLLMRELCSFKHALYNDPILF